MTFLNFFPLVWVIFALLDPDPDPNSESEDPITRLNPDPEHCYGYLTYRFTVEHQSYNFDLKIPIFVLYIQSALENHQKFLPAHSNHMLINLNVSFTNYFCLGSRITEKAPRKSYFFRHPYKKIAS
jgi:hypothetical protein